MEHAWISKRLKRKFTDPLAPLSQQGCHTQTDLCISVIWRGPTFQLISTRVDRVLFVCGTDDHGSTSELAALQAGKSIREFLDGIHAKQKETLQRYGVSLDTYTGTSRPECFPVHKDIVQDFLKRLDHNGMLEKRVSRQWYDPKLQRFLQDRFVRGECPNPKCDNKDAYSDECDRCGASFDPSELKNPRSALVARHVEGV
jgi:methionyl-tRNA synthetase